MNDQTRGKAYTSSAIGGACCCCEAWAMSKESIPKSTRHVRCLQELVEDQKQRVAFLRENGDVKAAHRAQSLLVVFEQCLASARYMLAAQPHGRGLEE